MKNFYKCFLLSIIILSGSVKASGTHPVDSSKILYTETLRQISRTEYDSALLTIREAYAFGLSNDSLFYAWAEIYSAKGALDTAIALSLAVKARPEHPLYYSVLKQRYLLFRMTNQTKRAESVFDTLNKLPVYRKRYLIPEISLFVKGGIQQNSIKEAEILPSYLDYAYPENEPARTAASGGLNLSWKYPIRKTMGFELTAGANLYQYNPPHPFQLKDAFDSSYSEEHVQLRYYIFSGMISCSYEFSSLREYSGVLSFNHKTDLSASIFVKDFFVFSNAGYNYDVDKDIHNWNGIVFTNRNWTKRRSNSISLSINGIHMQNDTILDYDWYRKMYVDGAKFYTDSTYAVQTFRGGGASRNLFDTTFISMVMPRSYISSKLSISQSFTLKHGFSLNVSIDGLNSWFIDFYKWASPPVVNENSVDAIYVFDKHDSTWNWSSDLTPIMQYDSITHPYSLEHQKKRVDQTITANGSFKKSFKNVVTIGVNGTVSRTFSNLRSYALVDIPDWSYSVMAFTTFRFNPAGRLR